MHTDLEVSYNNYLAIKNTLDYCHNEAIRRANVDLKFLSTIDFPFVGEVAPKGKLESINRLFNQVKEHHNNNTVMNVVGEFENRIFKKLEMASPVVKEFVTNNYLETEPMHRLRIGFIKSETDVYNLSGFKNFLLSHEDLKAEYDEIVDYRNYLAHGKRDGVGKPSNNTIDQIFTTLSAILELL